MRVFLLERYLNSSLINVTSRIIYDVPTLCDLSSNPFKINFAANKLK